MNPEPFDNDDFEGDDDLWVVHLEARLAWEPTAVEIASWDA